MAAENFSVFEVSPRDGLQNECREISFAQKVKFIEGLITTGVEDLEMGAFVRPDRVPQMADTDQLYQHFTPKKLRGIRPWSLVANTQGLERAIAAKVTHIAIFTAATDQFARANIGMSIAESLTEFKKIVKIAHDHDILVRAYVSVAFGCPFAGKVLPKQALRVVEKLAELGVEQVSIGDTIGIATPSGIDAVMKPAYKMLGRKKTAGHYHDTRGTALANALRSVEIGIRTLDSSAGGLGGCPFAPGATGNLATEDLLFMLHGMGFRTGIDLEKLCQVSLLLARMLKRPLTSRFLQAFSSSH